MNVPQFFQYLLQNRRRQFYWILAIFGITLFFVFRLDPNNVYWSKVLDPIFGLATALIALTIWWDEVRLERENKLPKKLTVRFIYDGQLTMICQEAFLVGETDIRAWGLHLGGRMGQGKLSLEPFFEVATGNPRKDKEGRSYKPYFLQFYLAQAPYEEGSVNRQRLEDGHYCRWVQDSGGKRKENWPMHPDALPPLHQNESL